MNASINKQVDNNSNGKNTVNTTSNISNNLVIKNNKSSMMETK